MVIDSNEEHEENALSSIEVRELGRVIEVK